MSKFENKEIEAVFSSRAEWHSTFLLNIVLIHIVAIVIGLITRNMMAGLLVACPLIVFTFTSGFFSYKNCPYEVHSLRNPDYTFRGFAISLLLIVAATVFTYIETRSAWSLLSFFVYALVLEIGDPYFLSEGSPADSRDADINEEEVSSFVSKEVSSSKTVNRRLEFGIILGQLGLQMKDFKIKKDEKDSLTLENKKGVSIRLLSKRESISVDIQLNKDNSVSLKMDSIEAIDRYRDILVACGKAILSQG